MSLRLYWVAVKTSHPLHVRHLLGIMAGLACDECGFAWPGMPTLCELAQISDRAVQATLKILLASGDVRIHAYPKGGRNRTTEYLVLPNEARTAAPCQACVQKTRKPRTNPQTNGPTPQPRQPEAWQERLALLQEQGRKLVAEEKARQKTPK